MKIILPLSVTIPRKTKDDRVWILNLNSYRNTHHMILNQAKILWKEIVYAATPVLNEKSETKVGIWALPGTQYHFTYTIFPNSGRKFDLANVCSIIQKFTDDALIEYGVIPDDSYKVIPKITYKFGGVDKINPRCELEIDTDLPF